MPLLRRFLRWFVTPADPRAVPVSAEEAERALASLGRRWASIRVIDGRHGIGTEMSMGEVSDLLRRADRLAWTENILGYDLVVEVDGRLLSLAVEQPLEDR